jgi:RNA polymerase sigma factor (sigma-70 family)
MNAKITFSDPALAEAIKRKRDLDQAVRFLYQEHAAVTRSFIMGRGGSEQDADDIFQETVISFIDSVQKEKFRFESGIRTFLISVAKNLWLNELRKRSRAGNREQAFETGREQEDPGISEIIGHRELKLQLQQLLDGLGDACRKILILFYYENLSMKEMVAHLHYENEQVVRNKKYKCLQQLTGMLKNNPLAARQINELIK